MVTADASPITLIIYGGLQQINDKLSDGEEHLL